MSILMITNRDIKRLLIILLASILAVSQLLFVDTQEVNADPMYPELVSKSSTGEESNMGTSGEPRISADGRYILYPSFSTNLGGQRAGDEGLYLYDRETGTTTLVSVDSDGRQAAGEYVHGYALSGDGRHVAFGSNFSSQTGEAYNTRVYVRDIDAQTTSLVSLDANNKPVQLSVPYISLSYDGSVIAFVTNSIGAPIYIRDIPNSEVSVLPSVNSQRLWLSDDGAKLLYYNGSSGAKPLIYNRITGTFQAARYEPDGSPATFSESYPVALSGNGRYAFVETTENCISEPNQSLSGCLLRTDLNTNTTEELSGIDPVWYVSASTDGSLVAYGGGDYSICDDSSSCIDFYPPAYLYNVNSGTNQQITEAPASTELGSILMSGNGKVITFFTSAANFGITINQQIIAVALGDSNPVGSVLLSAAQTPTKDKPNLSWSAVDGADSYNIYRNGSLVGSSNTTSYTDITAGEGTYDYYVTAAGGGNESDASNTITVVVDKTKPAMAFTAPASFTGPFSPGPTVTITATDSSGLQSMAIHVYKNTGQLLTTCGSANATQLAAGTMSCSLASLAAGSYYIKAGSFDKAGNNRTIISPTFTVNP